MAFTDDSDNRLSRPLVGGTRRLGSSPLPPRPFPRLPESYTAGAPTPQPVPEGSPGGDRLGVYGLGLNDSEEPIRDYVRQRPLSHRFRLLHPQERTSRAMPPFVCC